MKEQVLQFGEQRRLFGVLSRPDVLDPDRPVVVIPTTGVEHRVGPNRLHVHLCRAFADAGFAAFRLDVSGIGDSRRPPEGKTVDAAQDLQQGLDELARLGAGQKFVLVGLCSGAHDAHSLARRDPRVVGAAFLDGYTYPTLRYRLKWWKARLLDWQRLRGFIERKLGGEESDSRGGFAADQLTYFVSPTRGEADADYRKFIERGMQLFFAYTGETQHEYNYATQVLDVFPSLAVKEQVRVQYFPASDHTFSRTGMRSELVDHLLDWLNDHVAKPRA